MQLAIEIVQLLTLILVVVTIILKIKRKVDFLASRLAVLEEINTKLEKILNENKKEPPRNCS